MTRRTTALVTLLAVCTLALSAAAINFFSTGTNMTDAAAAFLDALDEEQRGVALMAYDDADRLDWHFVPRGERKGLQIRDMNAEQRRLTHDLLQVALSEIGYDKTTKVMQLEAILRELERDRPGAVRDPERYYVTLFDEPAADARWGLSFEGHHLSLNFVVDNGELVSHTPLFFGTNPAIVRDVVEGGLPEGTRVLDDEELLGFALLAALDDEQRDEAIISEEPLRDVRSGGDPQAPDTAPEGLAASAMNDEQQAILRDLIDAYFNNMPEDVAARRRREVVQAGYEAIHFAWAGAQEPGVGHYYRLQGPTFLLELANTQPDPQGRPANHVHALWRDVRGDFGIER